MKALELIKRLQDLYKDYGNLELQIIFDGGSAGADVHAAEFEKDKWGNDDRIAIYGD